MNASQPDVPERVSNKPWFRVNPDGTPDGWYSFRNGSWVQIDPLADSDRMEWVEKEKPLIERHVGSVTVWTVCTEKACYTGKTFREAIDRAMAAEALNNSDAAFIAAARQDVPALIAALREAWKTIAAMKEGQDECK